MYKTISINCKCKIFQEPLGKLIYNMGLIALKAQETESEDAAVLKVLAVLESLCKRMINCELYNFQLVSKFLVFF